MGIGVPSLLDIGVAEAARDLLDIDAIINEQGGVRVPEIMEADLRESCAARIGKLVPAEKNRACRAENGGAPAAPRKGGRGRQYRGQRTPF